MLEVGKDFIIYDNYAKKLHALSNKYDLFDSEESGQISLFQRNLDVFLIAPIIGLRKERYVEESNTEEKKEFKATINYSQLIKEEKRINYTASLLLLYGKEINLSYEERANMVFKRLDKQAKEIMRSLYMGYLKGGIDILYESLVESTDDIVERYFKLYDLIADFEMNCESRSDNIYDTPLIEKEILELGKY